MNEKNLEYLSNQLKYTGFGEGIQKKLKENIEKRVPEFVLYHQTEFGTDSVAATLHFRKSPETDMYFFNRYNMLLKSEMHPDPIKQTFYIRSKEDNVTFKEAYNLLSGRSAHKTLTNKAGEKAEGWMQLNFTEQDRQGNYKVQFYYPAYGYDLPKLIDRLPIREVQEPEQRSMLLQSLERGNRQAVTAVQDGKDVRFYIEAAPQFKQLNWYNDQQVKINAPVKKMDAPASSLTRDQKTEKKMVKQEKTSGDDAGEEPTARKRKGQRI